MFALIFIMHFKRLLKMFKFDRDIQMENIPLQNTLNNVHTYKYMYINQVQANIKCENREGILYNICYNEKHITSIIGLQLKCR